MGTVEPELPESLLQVILRKCDFKDVGRAACVDRRWRFAASDDSIWKELCQSDYDLSSPTDPHGNLCSSFQESYKSWHTSFGNYPHTLVLRAKHCWDSLRFWASSNFPEVANSLMNGVSEEELDNFEAELGLKLPLAVRLLYRFCGGQDFCNDLFDDDESDSDESDEGETRTCVVGLLGGYGFYNQMVNVHFLSLHKVLYLTKNIIPQLGDLEAGRKWVIVAASYPLKKIFFLDCLDGSLYVGTRNTANGELMPCVPNCSVTGNKQDSMLRWLEEYAMRLNNGMYTVQKFGGAKGISLFPDQGPLCTEAVSNGVQVRSSAVFVPERSTMSEDNGSNDYLFSYSIRMRLLPSGSGSHAHSLRSCQLLRRHWVILENGVVKDEVHGAAVIGKYPLLEAGGKTFSYASCSSLGVQSGSIYGHFTFVPGSLSRREGAVFLVEVAEFALEVPGFIY